MGKIIANILFMLALLATLAAAVYGYVHNIIVLVHHVGAFGIQELVRAAGIVLFPLGAVMGFVS